MVNRGIENAGLIRLAAPRAGHFLLESGHHGDRWLDLDALVLRPRSIAPFAAMLADSLAPHEVDVASVAR